MTDNIRIVMVRPSHPGNIGSAARAMKTMGLQHLYLVSPEKFPSAQATALAAGADDLLAQAKVFDSLNEAISDCELVIGTSARLRRRPWSMLTPEQAGQKVIAEASQAKVAIIFGHEKSGLDNDELQKCHYHVQIPANPEYNVLNLSQAIQILCYEVRKAMIDPNSLPPAFTPGEHYASAEDIERFYTHLHETLVDIGFLQPNEPKQVMTRLKRLFQRTRLDIMEIRILRGILSQMQWYKERAKQTES